MKRILLLLSVSLMISVVAFGQHQNTNTAQNQNPNAPVITFEKVIHDYGVLTKGGNGKCEFKFTNTGKEPLILSRPRSSCGCTVPTWPRQPILPGKSEIITLMYDTNRMGLINKTVTIYSNAKNNMVVLRIKGRVVKPE